MARPTSMFPILGLVSILAVPASAQAPAGGGPGQIIGLAQSRLLTVPEVQKDLKLDEAQVAKARALADKIRDDFATIQPNMRGLPRDAQQARMEELATPILDESMKTARSFLTPGQIKRFHQIDVQYQGVLAMTYPAIIKKVGITEEQGPKIRAVIVEFMGESRRIFHANENDRQAASAQVMVEKKEALEKVVAMLTEDQKKAWNELIGEPFEVPVPKIGLP